MHAAQFLAYFLLWFLMEFYKNCNNFDLWTLEETTKKHTQTISGIKAILSLLFAGKQNNKDLFPHSCFSVWYY